MFETRKVEFGASHVGKPYIAWVSVWDRLVGHSRPTVGQTGLGSHCWEEQGLNEKGQAGRLDQVLILVDNRGVLELTSSL